MELSSLFEPADFVLGFDPVDKWAAIDELLDHLVARGRVSADVEPALREALLNRERSMSTGMERGIAIPHAAVDGIDEVIATIGVVSKEGGLSFEAIDAQPSYVVVLLLIPRSQKLVHIRTLADVARVMGQESVRDALLAARSGEEAWQALRAGEAAPSG